LSATTTLVVVDDFLDDPDAVRALALRQTYVKFVSSGLRSELCFLDVAPYRAAFERSIGRPITGWDDNAANGRFQYCTADDPVVIHCDSQRWAAVLFLSPDAPFAAGLSLYRSRATGVRRPARHRPLMDATLGNGAQYDRTRWEEIDRVGNLYNRLVIWDAEVVHSASAYFGEHLENARLFQVFFFDVGS
jgi:hypothetical protein